MTLTDESIRPIVLKLSRWQWVVTTIVLGMFLAFVSALLIGALIGIVGIKLPWYFGVIAALIGLFVTGYLLGRFAPPQFLWEFPAGTVLFAILFMFMLSKGVGVLAFLAKYLLVPALAGAAGYWGVIVARKGSCADRTASPA